MKIMAFEAHPDDIDYLCSGTLAKYKAQGHEVAIACVTNGEVGSPTLSKKEIAAVRKKEAEKSAGILGAEFFWLGYPDEFLFNTPEVRLHIIETIRRFRPDLIITLDKDHDYHPDHTNTGQLIWDTHVMVTVPNIETESPPCMKIPEIYFMDTVAGINFLPEMYVDISEYWPIKEKMIQCHLSQDEWCLKQYDVHICDLASLHSRFRGYQAGCPYAEAFRKPKFYPQKTDAASLL